jgi:hypothetical protein
VVLVVTITLGPMLAMAESPYRGRVSEGMTVSDVVALLGEPGGRVEMETKREIVLSYPKGVLRFIEGRLVFPEAAKSELTKSVPTARANTGSASVEAVNVKMGTEVYKAKGPVKNEDVKLESVLGEVMRSKAGSPDSSTRPSAIPLNSGMPGGPSMVGMPPPGMPPPGMPGAPLGAPPMNNFYAQTESVDSDE